MSAPIRSSSAIVVYHPDTPPIEPKIRWSVGRVVCSLRANHAIERSGQDLDFFLERHVLGDWGDIDEATRRKHDQSLLTGGSVTSLFHTLLGETIILRTTSGRDLTSVMMAVELRQRS